MKLLLCGLAVLLACAVVLAAETKEKEKDAKPAAASPDKATTYRRLIPADVLRGKHVRIFLHFNMISDWVVLGR